MQIFLTGSLIGSTSRCCQCWCALYIWIYFLFWLTEFWIGSNDSSQLDLKVLFECVCSLNSFVVITFYRLVSKMKECTVSQPNTIWTKLNKSEV